jgi:AraC-like DNA-binding protein
MVSAIRQIPLDNATRHHVHEFHQIVIGLEGLAEFEIEGLGGRIASLNGCIVPANHVHYHAGLGVNRQLIFDLPQPSAVSGGEGDDLARLFEAPRFFELDTPLRTYLDFLVQETARRQGPSGDLLIATFLDCLHSRLSDAPAAAPPAARRFDLDLIYRFIESNLARRLSVADLARRACLSEAHFSECFRRQVGVSPYQYVLRRRLALARRLIAETKAPLSDVAVRAGFANQSALSHAFRRHFGHTPRQLRRNDQPGVASSALGSKALTSNS